MEELGGAAEGLLPCPFCGAGTTQVRTKRHSPVVPGTNATVISVEVTHFCERQPGTLTRCNIVFAGRDHASAFAAWNARAKT